MIEMGDDGDAKDGEQWLAERFEEYRPHLRSVAYRMLGSLTEADDAVQDAWVRFSRAGIDGVDNLGGWLTTIVARVSLNMLRSRTTRREDPLSVHVPDPVVERQDVGQPEDEALLADSVGLALLVVLDTLSPAERLAFVLHDMFDLPFDEIAPMVDRSPEAARQLASRARRRVRGVEPPSLDVDRTRQRQVVEAFLSAARNGDFDALVDLLHPGIVLRIDAGAASASMLIEGAEAVAEQSKAGLRSILNLPTVSIQPVLVNGSSGALVSLNGQLVSVMGFTISEGKITEIDSLADPARLEQVAQAFGAIRPDDDRA
jgi:RNA polymerase sigma factor (sigma-70 family)